MKITKEEALKIYADNADVRPRAYELAQRIMMSLVDTDRISDELVSEFNTVRPAISICAWCYCTQGTDQMRLEFAKKVHRQLVDRIMACFSTDVGSEDKAYIAATHAAKDPSYRTSSTDFSAWLTDVLTQKGALNGSAQKDALP